MDHVLEVDHLSIRFGDVEVLTDLSFSVAKGSSLAVIGPNGAGKTVLFQALIGSLPCEGIIRWAPDVRIGYVPQKLDLERDVPITSMDVLRARSKLTQDSGTDIARILDLVGISSEIGKNTIGTLSGGQFQRLLVAFALLGNPSVLLLDEPTAGVDAWSETTQRARPSPSGGTKPYGAFHLARAVGRVTIRNHRIRPESETRVLRAAKEDSHTGSAMRNLWNAGRLSRA